MTDPAMATLDGLYRAVLGTNPFRANRVSSPEDMPIDVVDVHGREFKRLAMADSAPAVADVSPAARRTRS
jgi:hypothetical protein